MATKQDLKAKALKELEEEQKRLLEQKKKAAEQAKANKEADLIGAKDAAKLNKNTSADSTANKAKNSVLVKSGSSSAVKQTASDRTAKAAGGQSGIDKIEAAKREKATAQAKANKEKDLPGFDGYAYQRAKQQQIEKEKTEYLNIKETRDKKSALEKELADLRNRAKEEGKKAGTVAIVASGMKGGTGSVVSAETESEIDRLEKEIIDLDKSINLAERAQSKKYLADRATKAEDFESYSHDPEIEEPEKRYNIYKSPAQKRETETVKGYMNEEERKIYNYYYNKFGEEKAEEYFESIRGDLNMREAVAIFMGNEGKTANQYLMGAAAGLDQAKSGYQNAMRMLFGDEKTDPTSVYQYLSGMAREDLADKGPKLPEALGGASLGQIGFDAVNTGANMLPSLMLGTLGGGAIGAAAIGTSAAGNAYSEALSAGYGKEQATNYAALVGASEAVLGYLLGGIEAQGGKLSKAALSKVLPKIDGALAKASVALPAKMLSEFSEEYLQEVLSPVFENIAFEEENKIDLLSPEAIYSGIMGALTAGASAVADGSAFGGNIDADIPVPFDGKAQPGTEAGLVAEKIAEIEKSSLTESEKAEKMAKIAEAVAETTASEDVIAEVEKFRNLHRQKELDRATEVANRLGNVVEFDEKISANGIHKDDGTIIINPNSKNPVMQILIHELTHDIETSGLYEGFSKKILDYAAEVRGINLAKMEQEVINDYAKAGQKLDRNLADREIVAKFAEEYLFTDEKAIERLCDTDPTVFRRIKYWIEDMIAKLKGTPEERFFIEAQRLYEKALASRGEVFDIEGEAESVGKSFDEIAMDSSEIQTIQNIGKISVNNFTSQDIKNTEKFAKKYLQEIGTKSPFFKSWFGDWRENDQTPVQIADKIGDARKTIKNNDTGWDIQVSGKVFDETLIQRGKKSVNARPYLQYINDITKKAVLLDSFGIDPNRKKSPNSLLMHSMYAVADIGNGPEILKLYVEEMYDPNKLDTTKRDYKLIDIQNNSVSVTGSRNSVSPSTQAVVVNTVADLFDAVKRYDPDFQPKPSSKVVNPDGTPKVVYHGTRNANFSVFNRSWNFFTDNKEMADSYSPNGDMYEVYLDIKNPFVVNAYGEKWSRIPISNEIKEILDNYGASTFEEDGEWRTTPADIASAIADGIDEGEFDYDGIIIENVDDTGGYYKNSEENIGTDYIVFDSRRVKSATDNIGTFDPQNPDIRYSTGRSFDELAEEAAYNEMQETEDSVPETVETASMQRAEPKFTAENWMNIAESIGPESKMWRMKDFARVLDNAAGGNKVLRQQLYELYEKPLNEAKGTYAKNYEAKVKSFAEKFKKLGIKAGSKESAAVQRIGEGKKEIDKNGNTVDYTLDDLKKDFPDSWENIKEAADYCREVYDEFLHDLNAMYSEIYPATVEQANERVSGYDTRIRNDAEYIDRYKEVIDNLENTKAEKQKELAKKRPDSLVYAEIQNQIANIDHKIEVANERISRIQNRKLTKEIARDTLKAQIENGEILRNKQIKPRKDYFRHFQEITNEFAEIADIFSNDQRIPPELAGKSADTKPRTIWTSIAQSRSGQNYYTEDAVGGLLKYTEVAEKLLVFDPLISHFRDVNSAIRAAGTMVDNEVKGKGYNAGQFASLADDITNQLAGKTNFFDRAIADKAGEKGRAVMKAIEALNRRVKSNAILGNFRSAVVQIGNLPNASLYIQNPKSWATGTINAIRNIGKQDTEIKEARSRSDFMNRRYMGDSIDKITKGIQENKLSAKPKEFAIWMLGAGDRAAAEIIWHTAYAEALRNPNVLFTGKNKLRDYENAIDYADDITRRSIGGRAEGEIPYFEESKAVGLIAPFQIEVANTFNAFTEQLGKKNAAGIIAFEINVFLMNCILEAMTGDRPLGLDYIDAAWDIIKEGIDEDEEEEDFWDFFTYALGEIAGETLSGMPFGTQIGSAITGGDEQKAEEWFGDRDPTRYGTGNIGIGAFWDAVNYFKKGETPEKFAELATDLVKNGETNTYADWAEPVLDTVDTFAPLLMSWGGKQTARTANAIDQLIQGGAYGTEADGDRYMKFAQEYDPASIVKNLLFGPYAAYAGQNYIDSGFKDKLSAEQTKQMEIAHKEYGMPKDVFYETVLGLKPYKKEEEKQEALFNNPDITASQKDIIDYLLFGKPTTKAIENDVVAPERVYTSEEGFYRSGLSDADKRLFDAGYAEKEIEAIDKGYDRGRNKGEKIDNIQNALDCSKAEAFEIYSRKTGDWNDELPKEEIERAEKAAEFYGMSTEKYLTVLNLSKFGAQTKDGYSTKAEDVIPNIAEVLGIYESQAKKYYNQVVTFEYSKADLSEENAKNLETAGGWYDVDEKGYFTARNVCKDISGKDAQIKEIAKQLKIDEQEATIYYLAAKGDLALSKEDLSEAKKIDITEAVKHGWTEKQFLDAVNILKITGASKKDEIIQALLNAGASYEMALGYYNLSKNYDYYKRG